MFALPLNIARVIIGVGALALIGVTAKKVADHRSVVKSRSETETEADSDQSED